jgi:hypothetical protein
LQLLGVSCRQQHARAARRLLTAPRHVRALHAARCLVHARSADPLAASILPPDPPGLGAAAAQPTAPPAVPLSKQQLLDLAATFVQLWFEGLSRGPQAVEQQLAGVLAPDVQLQADQVKSTANTQVRARVRMLCARGRD